MKTKWSLFIALLVCTSFLAHGTKINQNNLGRIVGDWDVWIPGAVSHVTSETRIYSVYQPGAAMNRLSIKSNGQYTWGEKSGSLKKVTPWYADPAKSYYQVEDIRGNTYDFWYKSESDELILLFGEVGGMAATGTRWGLTADQGKTQPATDQDKKESATDQDKNGQTKDQAQEKTTDSPFQVGDAVEIDWSGMWYKGTVKEVASGKYKVHYEGWSDTYDEWVGPERLRKTAGSGKTVTEKEKPKEEKKATTETKTTGDKTSDSPTYQKNQKVEINWSGTWYKGTILEVSNGKYKVRYDGWGSAYDEWVGQERLRK